MAYSKSIKVIDYKTNCMDSKDLEKFGFKEWIAFSELPNKQVPDESGVYILRLNKKFNRLVGESDILYIGSNPRNGTLHFRLIENYLRGRGGKTTQRIHSYLVHKGYKEKVSVSWVTKKLEMEKKLREQYEQEHHEFPPWNRQG